MSDSYQTSGSSPSAFPRPAAFIPSTIPARVALLGFGTVGSAVARRLASGAVPGLQLTTIFDRRAAQKRPAVPHVAWTSSLGEVLAGDADIIVEAIGGIDPAADWIRAALARGKSVVTANKQVVAHHGAGLAALAARQGRQLRFEAAVGGAMPIVRAVGDGLAGDRIVRIAGVLNGTSNAVLSRMDATGCTMAEAVAEAQARGYAEADPAADLDGIDARAKLAILCGLAFGVRFNPGRIDTRSLSALRVDNFAQARRWGGALRQLAWAEYDDVRNALTAWVAPAIVPRASIFARLTGPENAAIVTGAHAGETGVFGRGAGGEATAVAVISDLLAIARDRAAVVPAPALRAPATISGLGRGTHIVNFLDSTGAPCRPQQPARAQYSMAEAV